MKKRLNVTVLADTGTLPIRLPFSTPYRDGQPTEFHTVKALRECGHAVSLLGVFDNVTEIVTFLHENKPDVVLNLTEQFRGNRWLDKDVAGLLELCDVPFTGTGSTGLMLSRNKAVCKHVLGPRRIRVPAFVTFEPGRAIRPRRSLRYPLVAKPLYEDSSDGIANASLVASPQELIARTRMLHDRFEQPVIAEEYIEGRELYVAVLGNSRLRVLPPRELRLNESGGPVMATSRVKWNKTYRRKWNIRFGFARLTPRELERVTRTAKRAYRLLKLQDFGRIDCRLTPAGEVVVLEANANPDIGYKDEVAESARKAGIPYPQFIDMLLRIAIIRHQRSH